MKREKAINVLEDALSRAVFMDDIDVLEMAIAALREQEDPKAVLVEHYIKVPEKPKWISVEERLPDAAQGMEGVLGFVNGYNGRITFTDASLFVKYDYVENAWWSEDYDIEGCKVTHWMPLPEPPKEEE